jgi:hypothetical protein
MNNYLKMAEEFQNMKEDHHTFVYYPNYSAVA